MIYVYCFSVWPDETWGFSRPIFDVFHAFNQISQRVEMRFSQVEFEVFRSKLKENGFTLREIERWPYHEPEAVL